MALSAAAVVASVLLLRPTGAEVESEDDIEAAIMSDSVDFAEIQDGAVRLVARHDYLIRHAAQPPEPRAERLKRRVSRENADAGEYLDPDALPVSFSGGSVFDIGEFLDPERDIPPPVPADGVADVGDYLAPEQGP